jgi:hypothetical protein
MTVLGMVRLSHNEIRQIIVDHMSAKYGMPVQKVELWPPKDIYGNAPYADVNMLPKGPLQQTEAPQSSI